MAAHSPALICLMVLNILLYILNQVLSLLGNSMTGGEPVLRIYPRSIGNQSDINYLEITPSSATFSIWGPIYIWQFVWIIYSIVNICRKTDKGPVYTNPVLLGHGFFIAANLNWSFIITWGFLWSYGFEWYSFVCLFLIAFTIYIMIGLSYKSLANHEEELMTSRRGCVEIWLVRILVQNGLAFYGAWCTVATLLNMGSALSYDVHPRYDQSTSSTIALSILSAELVIFVISDWTILDKYSRYTVTPYIVLIVALAGSISKNWNPAKTNSIFTAVLLAVAGTCCAIKVIVLLFRHFKGERETCLRKTEKTKL